MIPVIPRQVVLLSGPAWKPPPFRPPVPAPSLGLERRPGLGEGPSFNWMNIGETIMFAAAGAGAMYAAPLFPDPVKTMAMIGGVGLIGYSAYSLLARPASADEAKKSGFTTPVASDFSAVTGKFIKPLPGENVGFNLLSNTYDVDVLAYNPSQKNEVTVTFQLVAREAPWWTYLVGSPSEPYIADVRIETLKKNESKPIKFTPLVKTSRWLSGNETVTLLLQKVGVDSAGKQVAVTLAQTNVVVGFSL